MSHFYTLVLVNSYSANRKKIETQIAELLYKYSENLEVEEYDHECYCKNNTARNSAEDDCAKKFGPFDEIRKAYWEKIDAKIDPKLDRNNFEALLNAREEVQKTLKWEDHTAEWNAYKKEREQQHPMYNKFNPDCDECKGTGTYRSTCNPLSKWDWYQIGGRWSGILDSYDPSTDPDNIETCFICGGTGIRDDQLGQQARAENPNYTCNGCQGKGTCVKWPSQLKAHSGDIQPTEKVLAIIEKSQNDCPFALITPDGEWYEKGEMGWFGCASNESELEDWHKCVNDLLQKNINTMAVVVDCHI